MADASETFGVADEKITAGYDLPREFLHQFLLRRTVEIDHHVAAEDHLKKLVERWRAFEEIQALKIDGPLQARFNAEIAFLWTVPALKMFPDACDFEFADGF